MNSENDDLLSRLLDEVRASNTPAALREAASDAAHVDAATLAQLAANELDEERSRAVRRHVLFCDQCRDLSLDQTATGPESESRTPASGSATTAVVPQKTRNRFGLAITGVALALALLMGFLVVKATENETGDAGDDLVPKTALMTLMSLGTNGVGQRGVIRIDEPVVLELPDDFGTKKQFVYVLLLDAHKQLSLIEPQSEPAVAQQISGGLRLPVKPPGWDLAQSAEVKVGDELNFIIIITVERIPALEGDIARKVTVPALQQAIEAAQPSPKRVGLSETIAAVRTFGFGGLVRGLTATVRV